MPIIISNPSPSPVILLLKSLSHGSNSFYLHCYLSFQCKPSLSPVQPLKESPSLPYLCALVPPLIHSSLCIPKSSPSYLTVLEQPSLNPCAYIPSTCHSDLSTSKGHFLKRFDFASQVLVLFVLTEIFSFTPQRLSPFIKHTSVWLLDQWMSPPLD